ncbi:MAG: hypothetical protein KatS3mg126_1359 [Lysobacteraceae bacterium]|nr:MAG: hypothetical protein KatS3mg126_1359 [Xanthomonadaceae bacterium]
MRQGGFHGGLRLDGQRHAATRPIRRCALPAQLLLALRQHPGPPALPLVEPGQTVRAGQCIARGDGPLAADLHAPCHGVVEAVDRQGDGSIVLRTDPTDPGDPSGALPALDPEQVSAAAIRARIAEAGIVGLGGAAFPTAAKLSAPTRIVLLNGIECEPLVACDRRLLIERGQAVLAGGALLGRALGARELVLAVEDDLPELVQAVRALHAPGPGFRLEILPARYPQGSERQLIESVFGLRLAGTRLPRDAGIAVFNVATAEAVWQAVRHGRPLTHRLVGVAGDGVAEPVVLDAALGTPLAELVAAAGGYREDAARLILGGPLTGRPLPDDGRGLRKGDHAVTVLAGQGLPDRAPAMPCIRCGACAAACPARLQPQLLWQFHLAGDGRRQLEHGLFDCIECAVCDMVCPSRIPLAAGFAADKEALREQAQAHELAMLAARRHAARSERLQREAVEREAEQAEALRRELARKALLEALAQTGKGGPGSRP